MFDGNPPLGLYVHLPWCERKCPYCDFNSHQAGQIPESDYIAALLIDLEQDLPLVWGRRIESLFIGGGTPSLFSADAVERLLSGLRALLNFAPNIEITLEANPGSADAGRFRGYREAGVNRLSIGVQSFDDRRLETLGRVHDRRQALAAFDKARAAGFDNINLDLMFALPEQEIAVAADDLSLALSLGPEHVSHYQLTIEPNTLFHHAPPAGLPDDDTAWDQQQACRALFARHGYAQYEISAWQKGGRESRHNLNYWHFGDYIGIGAGAHGKLTLSGDNRVLRRVRQRQPAAYLKCAGRDRIVRETELTAADLCFEFMLNALRLSQGVPTGLFRERTGIDLARIAPTLEAARDRGLLTFDAIKIRPSETGFTHLNELQAMFLDTETGRRRPLFESSWEIMHN